MTFLDTDTVYAESAIKQEGKIMTFDEFWENNYAKAFGECEPYYGIASHAFEAGQQNCNCVHTDNSAVIEELEKQKSELKVEVSQLDSELREKIQIIHDLREQLPKWHKVADGDLPEEDSICLVCCDAGNGYKYTSILKYDVYDEELHWLDDDNETFDDVVIAWCEIPKFEEE